MARRKPRNPQKEYNSYMGDVGSYLKKVDAGRSVRSVDPNQPAFSHDAETIRQSSVIDKANKFFGGSGKYREMFSGR